MASNINPQNIDGAYPVAGQDNDSQGFRDNFTNTRTNFSFAAAEITDLQNKAVLKAALVGTVLNNDMGGSILSNAQLQDMSETRVALGTVTGTQTINYAAGPYYTLTTSGSVSIVFTNFPPAGQLGRVRLQIAIASTAHTLTLPAAVSVGTSNIQGYAANIITFNQTGTFEFEFETNDGGATITIIDQNRNLDPIYLPSSEDLAASAAANLSLTTSFFTTAAAETATLAAGSAGQIKVLAAANVAAGDMVVTVSNAGWKASGTGTITFDDIGQTATLIYINSKWYVIGQGAGASNTLAQFA
jgi:hypothetical protein